MVLWGLNIPTRVSRTQKNASIAVRNRTRHRTIVFGRKITTDDGADDDDNVDDGQKQWNESGWANEKMPQTLAATLCSG